MDFQIFACSLCKFSVKFEKNKLICLNKNCAKEYKFDGKIPLMLV